MIMIIISYKYKNNKLIEKTFLNKINLNIIDLNY